MSFWHGVELKVSIPDKARTEALRKALRVTVGVVCDNSKELLRSVIADHDVFVKHGFPCEKDVVTFPPFKGIQ